MNASSGMPGHWLVNPRRDAGFESEARIVRRVADHDDEGAAAIVQQFQAAPHQRGADTLSLM